MSGKKGRSGRYPKNIENYRAVVIQKAWNKTNYKLDQSDPQSYTIASQIVVKDITEKQSVDMSAHITQEEQGILARYRMGGDSPIIINRERALKDTTLVSLPGAGAADSIKQIDNKVGDKVEDSKEDKVEGEK